MITFPDYIGWTKTSADYFYISIIYKFQFLFYIVQIIYTYIHNIYVYFNYFELQYQILSAADSEEIFESVQTKQRD